MRRRRAWFYPRNNVTAGVWLYLRNRFPPAEAEERRERLALSIKRLVTGKGVAPIDIHAALLEAVHLLDKHHKGEAARQYGRHLTKLDGAARRDLDRAIRSLERLWRWPPFRPPNGTPAEMRALYQLREALAPPLVGSFRRPRRGRPWEHVTKLKADLRRLKVPAEDRQEILSALLE